MVADIILVSSQSSFPENIENQYSREEIDTGYLESCDPVILYFDMDLKFLEADYRFRIITAEMLE